MGHYECKKCGHYYDSCECGSPRAKTAPVSLAAGGPLAATAATARPPAEPPTPAELAAAIKAAREPAILSEVAHVTAELQKRWDGASTLTVLARSPDARVQEEVAERFRAKGWAVKLGGSQREGAHYALTPAK